MRTTAITTTIRATTMKRRAEEPPGLFAAAGPGDAVVQLGGEVSPVPRQAAGTADQVRSPGTGSP